LILRDIQLSTDQDSDEKYENDKKIEVINFDEMKVSHEIPQLITKEFRNKDGNVIRYVMRNPDYKAE